LATYGLRNWVEYGKSKNELGWADFRMTSYAQIERWWEIVMSAYLLVSLHTTCCINRNCNLNTLPQAIALKLVQHPDWNQASSWKQVLNNLRLVIQPSVILNLLQPWLNLFPIPRLSRVRVFNRADESLSSSLPCHEPYYFFFCLE